MLSRTSRYGAARPGMPASTVGRKVGRPGLARPRAEVPGHAAHPAPAVAPALYFPSTPSIAGEPDIARRQAAGVMRAEGDLHPVPDIRPFRWWSCASASNDTRAMKPQVRRIAEAAVRRMASRPSTRAIPAALPPALRVPPRPASRHGPSSLSYCLTSRPRPLPVPSMPHHAAHLDESGRGRYPPSQPSPHAPPWSAAPPSWWRRQGYEPGG